MLIKHSHFFRVKTLKNYKKLSTVVLKVVLIKAIFAISGILDLHETKISNTHLSIDFDRLRNLLFLLF